MHRHRGTQFVNILISRQNLWARAIIANVVIAQYQLSVTVCYPFTNITTLHGTSADS